MNVLFDAFDNDRRLQQVWQAAYMASYSWQQSQGADAHSQFNIQLRTISSCA